MSEISIGIKQNEKDVSLIFLGYFFRNKFKYFYPLVSKSQNRLSDYRIIQKTKHNQSTTRDE